VSKLTAFAKEKKAFAIPHHVAYKQGWRGANWDYFDPDVTPVVEIFSEHGCTESDRAPFPMILHSNGGRSTSNTVDYQLRRNKRFGFVASSDDHFGYPGAWGEGVVGVWAGDLSSASLFDAIRKRRTIAATGDRIALDFSLNGNPLGSEIPWTDARRIEVSAAGQDAIKMLELVKNGRVVKRAFPGDFTPDRPALPGRVKCRIQYGWGPWSTLKLERICSWDMTIRISGGRFLEPARCFQSGPFSEELRDRLERIDDRTFRLRSFTSRNQAYLEDPTKAVVMEIEGTRRPNFRWNSRSRPGPRRRSASAVSWKTMPSFSPVSSPPKVFVIHRLTGREEYEASAVWRTSPRTGRSGTGITSGDPGKRPARLVEPIWVG
jgi:hypothetical protein